METTLSCLRNEFHIEYYIAISYGIPVDNLKNVPDRLAQKFRENPRPLSEIRGQSLPKIIPFTWKLIRRDSRNITYYRIT